MSLVKFKTIKYLSLGLCLSAILSSSSFAETVDGIPIPPKRPDVMSASPAYIDYLNNRESGDEYLDDEPIESEEKINNELDLPLESETAIKNMDTNDILAVIDNVVKTIPNPPKKPFNIAQANTLNDVQTQAGDEDETTLVSFALEPGEIHINQNIEEFLKNHALKLFNENKNLTMNIHAYATSIDNSSHSDVRLSLARALEVRSFLIKQNVNPSRLKLSPLGKDAQNTSDDRIDLVFIAPTK
ncbi:MAG: OmpA family protein [Alphaproteobacteria bacterium]